MSDRGTQLLGYLIIGAVYVGYLLGTLPFEIAALTLATLATTDIHFQAGDQS